MPFAPENRHEKRHYPKNQQPGPEVLPCFYWKSSLNMAQPEAGAGDWERSEDKVLLKTFPSPASAKQIKERMRTFFIVHRRYCVKRNPACPWPNRDTEGRNPTWL